MPLTITAKRAGHRRCNMRHPDKPVTHEDGAFSEAEIAILKADPALIVVETKADTKTAAKAKPEADAKAKAAAKAEAEAKTDTKDTPEAK